MNMEFATVEIADMEWKIGNEAQSDNPSSTGNKERTYVRSKGFKYIASPFYGRVRLCLDPHGIVNFITHIMLTQMSAKQGLPLFGDGQLPPL